MTEVLLHQFPFSHFNDKARWALDFKGIAHRRRSHLPGPHMPAIKKLSGQTSTPVLCFDDRVIPGSAQIIDALERSQPEPALYPADPAQRERALAVQREFDDHVGPQVRLALFSVLLQEPGYLCGMFSTGHSALKRLMYRAMFPLAKGLIRKGNGVVSQEAIDGGYEATQAAFDRVAKETGSTGYLVGDRFSVADLAAAALLAPAVSVPHPDMAKPQPMPKSMQEWIARWAEHPGAAWVLEMYRRHRPASSALA